MILAVLNAQIVCAQHTSW